MGTFCGLIYASQMCMSASSVEKWVKMMHAAQVSAPPGFLRRLLGALHGVTFKVCQKLQFEEQQALFVLSRFGCCGCLTSASQPTGHPDAYSFLTWPNACGISWFLSTPPFSQRWLERVLMKDSC